jgi:hypothetical protein
LPPKAGDLAIDRKASVARLQRHCLERARAARPVDEDDEFADYLGAHGVGHLVDAGETPIALALLMAPRPQPRGPALVRPPSRRHEVRIIDAIDGALRSIDSSQGSPAASAAMLARLDPSHLSSLLAHRDYETGKYRPVIRALIQFHPQAWSRVAPQVVAADDIVARNDIGVAHAEAWHAGEGAEREDRFAQIVGLARSDNADDREIAGYALKHIAQKLEPGPGPWWQDLGTDVFRDLVAGYACSGNAIDRMVGGEIMLALTLQGVDVTTWLDGREGQGRFWQPPWANQRVDVVSIHAHGSGVLRWAGPRPADLEGSFASALAQRDEAIALGAAFGRHAQFSSDARPSLQRLSWAVGAIAERAHVQFGDQQCDKVALDETLDELVELVDQPESRDLVYKVIRRLMLHPLWDLTETGSSLVADLVKRKGRTNGPWWIIDRLLDEKPVFWRLLYGGVDAAFNLGGVDRFAAFGRALAKVGTVAQCRVRGICADNLRMWLKRSTPQERRSILDDAGVRRALRCWVETADDEWLLEYVHLIFRESVPPDLVHDLLVEPRSPYLDVAPGGAFHQLTPDEFRDAIERLRQARTDSSAVAGTA